MQFNNTENDCSTYQAHESLVPELKWFCLRTQNKREHIAASNLQKLSDIEVYCPRIRYHKPTCNGPVWWTEAMFPNYVFARFDAATLIKAVQYSNGVSSIVCFNGVPAAIPDFTMDDLRLHLGKDEVRVITPEIRVGDSVTLARGAFHGLEALVTQVLPAKNRVWILLEFLGRMTEIETNRCDIAVARI